MFLHVNVARCPQARSSNLHSHKRNDANCALSKKALFYAVFGALRLRISILPASPFVLCRDTQLIVHFIQCLSGWTLTGLKIPTGKEIFISFPLLEQNETAQDLVWSLDLSVINLIPISPCP
jgi:hypothetical protein